MITAWLCCLAIVGGQVLPPDDKALIDAVWAALQARPEQARQHRGFCAYLETHADIASAEEACENLRLLQAFRVPADAFEEVLIAHEDTRRAWDRYNEALARNDVLRAAEDTWYRAVLSVDTVRRDGGAAVFYLQTHTEDALRFLENPARLVPTPEVLYPLRAFFATHPRVREEWRDALRALDQRAAAHDSVFEWWKRCPPEYRELFEYLAGHPSAFWVWRRHDLAWAADPHARDWARYWRGCVRRDTALAGDYDAYMLFLRGHPEWQRAATAAWEKTLGVSAAWPPEGEPPVLAPRSEPRAIAPATPKVFTHKPATRRDRSTVMIPEMPVMPERPQLKEPSDSRFKRRGLETDKDRAPQ